MNTTHVGKIGRLPKCVRDMLGQRIEDGQPGNEIVKWLNSLLGVQMALQEQFDGRPVTEQNLSEWKQSGHPEWLRHEETRLAAIRLTEESNDLEEAADGYQISGRFAGFLAAEMIRLAMTLLEKETDPEKRWQRLCAVHQELSQLRHDDHRAAQTAIRRAQWNHESERQEDEEFERAQKAHKDRLTEMCLAPLYNRSIAESFGGGEYGKRMAEMLHRIKFGLPLKDWLEKTAPGRSDPAQPNPAESSLIQPNPG